MFAGHNVAASAWLIALLVAWAALLLGSVVASFRSRQRMATWLRPASSAILVLAAWSWYLVARDTPGVSVFALLVALGMTLGFVGDLLLADALPIKFSNEYEGLKAWYELRRTFAVPITYVLERTVFEVLWEVGELADRDLLDFDGSDACAEDDDE